MIENKALVSLSASLCDLRAHPAQHWTCGRGLCFAMLIWLWTMETFASSISCWLANRERESTNMWNCKKGKFYYLEQILKTTENGKVLTCESERSKQLKSESFTFGTDQYKNIPLSSVTTESSNHAVIFINLLLGNPNGVAGQKKGSLWGAARTSTGSPSGAWKYS